MPFMMPLLCVAARYGSTRGEVGGDDDAVARLLARVALARELRDGDPATRRARATRSARFERMRRNTSPPVIASTSGATPSHMPLTRFAPIASRVSTSRCTTSIGLPLERQRVHEQLDVARAAAARDHVRVKAVREVEDLLLAIAQRVLRAAPCRAGSRPGSGRSGSDPSPRARKPPDARTSLRREPSAATTDGSSTTIGTTYSLPLTRKFMPRPSGRPMTPTTFSIILSAASRSSVCLPLASARKSVVLSRPRSCTSAHPFLDAQLVELGNAQAVRTHLASSPTLVDNKAVLGQAEIDHSKSLVDPRHVLNALKRLGDRAHKRDRGRRLRRRSLCKPRRSAGHARRTGGARP